MKPTSDFWHSLGWAAIWLGLLGGIALIVWADKGNMSADDRARIACTNNHGSWVEATHGSGAFADVYYTCDYGSTK